MKINLKVKNTLVLISLSITFLSCEYNVEEENIIGDVDEIESCDPSISFATDIKPIIDTNCVRCHGGSRFPNLSSYQGISNNAAIVKTQVVNRTMPQGGSLSNDQIELIRCWIENGAINN